MFVAALFINVIVKKDFLQSGEKFVALNMMKWMLLLESR